MLIFIPYSCHNEGVYLTSSHSLASLFTPYLVDWRPIPEEPCLIWKDSLLASAKWFLSFEEIRRSQCLSCCFISSSVIGILWLIPSFSSPLSLWLMQPLFDHRRLLRISSLTPTFSSPCQHHSSHTNFLCNPITKLPLMCIYNDFVTGTWSLLPDQRVPQPIWPSYANFIIDIPTFSPHVMAFQATLAFKSSLNHRHLSSLDHTSSLPQFHCRSQESHCVIPTFFSPLFLVHPNQSACFWTIVTPLPMASRPSRTSTDLTANPSIMSSHHNLAVKTNILLAHKFSDGLSSNTNFPLARPSSSRWPVAQGSCSIHTVYTNFLIGHMINILIYWQLTIWIACQYFVKLLWENGSFKFQYNPTF